MLVRCGWALAVVLAFAGRAWADEQTNVREAAMSFARALSEGKAEQARKYAMSNEATTSFIELVTPLVAAETKLHDASVARFGQAGAAITNGGTPAEAFNEYSKHPGDLAVNINGEDATIQGKAAPDPRQKTTTPPPALHLKKVESQWKVDLTDLAPLDVLKKQAPQLRGVAKAMSETADEIQAGKYASVREAKVALAQKAMAYRGTPAK